MKKLEDLKVGKVFSFKISDIIVDCHICKFNKNRGSFFETYCVLSNLTYKDRKLRVCKFVGNRHIIFTEV